MPKHNILRDPRLLEDQIGGAVGLALVRNVKVVLGLDPGTTTGVCVCLFDPAKPAVPADHTFWFGQWDLSAGSFDSGAIRFLRLRQFLAACRPDLIGYESPKYTPAEMPGRVSADAIVARAAPACELIGAFKSTICTWAEEFGVPCVGIPISALKKLATGKGNANKADMIRAANVTFGLDLAVEGYETSGVDNVADAAFACLHALEQYGEGFRPKESA